MRRKNSTLIMGSRDDSALRPPNPTRTTATELLTDSSAFDQHEGGTALGVDRSLQQRVPPPARPSRVRGVRRSAASMPRPSPMAHIRNIDASFLSNDGADAPPPAPVPASITTSGPSSTRPPVSSRLESQWFSPNGQAPASVPYVAATPLMSDLEERKGWVRPSGSSARGIAFAAVSLLLVGVAAAGTFFFLAPETNKEAKGPEPVSTTNITSGDMTPTPPVAPGPETAVTDTATAPTVQRTMTPADLPTAPVPVAATPAAPPMKTTTATTPPAPHAAPKAQPAKQPAKNVQPVTDTKAGSSSQLPDLDRAARAAGMTPSSSDDTSFSTPSPSPAPSQESQPGGTTPDTNDTNRAREPAPSEVAPDLQIKR